MKREKLQWMKAKVGKNKDVYKECCIPFDISNVNIILNAVLIYFSDNPIPIFFKVSSDLICSGSGFQRTTSKPPSKS